MREAASRAAALHARLLKLLFIASPLIISPTMLISRRTNVCAIYVSVATIFTRAIYLLNFFKLNFQIIIIIILQQRNKNKKFMKLKT